jgi:hypothetical protein
MKEFFDNTWVQRFLPAVIMAAFVLGGVWFQFKGQSIEIADIKTDLEVFQSDIRYLQIDQAKDNDFRASGERFSQGDGTQLELRSRDYTDQRIESALNTISARLTELATGLTRVNDKIDELAVNKLP